MRAYWATKSRKYAEPAKGLSVNKQKRIEMLKECLYTTSKRMANKQAKTQRNVCVVIELTKVQKHAQTAKGWSIKRKNPDKHLLSH